MEIVLAALIFGGCLTAAAYFWFRAQALKNDRLADDLDELSSGNPLATPLRPPAPDAHEGEMMDASDMLDDFDDATRVASVSPEALRAATKK